MKKQFLTLLLCWSFSLQSNDGLTTNFDASEMPDEALSEETNYTVSGQDHCLREFPKGFPLHHAISEGRFNEARSLIAAGANIEAETFDGVTPLHLAASFIAPGHVQMVEFLLEKGANPNAKDLEHKTPLHHVNRLEVAKLLIANGADPHIKTIRNQTILHRIARRETAENSDLVTFLLETGVNPNAIDANGETALDMAVTNGLYTFASTLIAYGADFSSLSPEKDPFDWSPLSIAVMNQQPRLVSLLIEHGADLHKKNADGTEAIHLAARSCKNSEILDYLLSKGANLSATSYDGRTALHCAAAKGNAEMVKALLDAGANPHLLNHAGETPLLDALFNAQLNTAKLLLKYETHPEANRSLQGIISLAVEWREFDILKDLIEQGFDVNVKEARGRCPLLLAGAKDQFHVLELLVQKGADLQALDTKGNSILHFTVPTENKQMIEWTLDQMKAHENFSDWINAVNSDGETALHIAVTLMDLSIARLLIEQGADIHKKCVYGRTPLHLAVESIELTELLLANGAKIDVVDHNGKTPLYFAVSEGKIEVVERLIDFGADLQGDEMQSLLHWAVGARKLECVRLLIEKGADIHSKSKDDQMTPLHYAALVKDESLAAMILAHGGDPLVKLDNGGTPLHYAAMFSSRKVAELLLKHNADIEAADISGCTPLMLSICSGNLKTAKLLVEKGANVNAKDLDGYTPLHYALSKWDKNMVDLLIEAGADIEVLLEEDKKQYQIAEDRISTFLFGLHSP
ncbi:MAG: ankyrin repeat domain-containing protein [Chlamydiales bacterium]|nr:ankyrin repeat domain-containing protein [Chlamydiales bacterium]MBY0529915.1 ankyrin repeat domain-containing protein [Rhabdochlamydiaceae bacterium]